MNKKRVLVVDDDPTIIEMLKKGFEIAGFDVDTAENKSDVQISLHTKRPDIIIMDVGMPGEDGISITREIKFTAETRSIPVVIITAFNDDKTYHDAMLFGATDFITKPFTMAEVEKKVREVLKNVPKEKEKGKE